MTSEVITIEIPEWIQHAALWTAVGLLALRALRVVIVMLHKILGFRINRTPMVSISNEPLGIRAVWRTPVRPPEHSIYNISTGTRLDTTGLFFRGVLLLIVRWAYGIRNQLSESPASNLQVANLNANQYGPGVDYPFEEVRRQFIGAMPQDAEIPDSDDAE